MNTIITKAMILALSLMLTLTACTAEPTAVSAPTDAVASSTQATQEKTIPTEADDTAQQTQTTAPLQTEPPQEETQPVKITLTTNGQTATVELLDNSAVADFLTMLPLTLTFEDFNAVEKISTLPRELNIGDAPTSCDPDVGSFAYYAPWGNLSVFYNDFRQSNNLIPLGTFESGIDIFAQADGEFTVTIERR